MNEEEEISKFISKYTLKTKSRDERKGWFVWLKIDQQRFRMCDPSETKKHANWMRRQLAIALLRLTKQGVENKACSNM